MHVYRPDEEILKDFQTLRCSELQCLFCSVGEAGKGCGSPLSPTTSGQPGKKLGDVLNPPEIQFPPNHSFQSQKCKTRLPRSSRQRVNSSNAAMTYGSDGRSEDTDVPASSPGLVLRALHVFLPQILPTTL